MDFGILNQRPAAPFERARALRQTVQVRCVMCSATILDEDCVPKEPVCSEDCWRELGAELRAVHVPDQVSRDERIAVLALAGVPVRHLGAYYGVTPSRIRQIIDAVRRSTPGGPA
ncbi:hypothetical protein [Zhihengliuella flava]|uniref:Uncharacterized protein n=1 Tax=Zhihengliuella flava TaxID=1285193 RepID=A0A931DE32_9MICC|nr:hypothetical protein [Zhihengliuella flava]MBG6085798.1 hypothetical protein [Zhihengliuella flava]MBG6085876.1 hypothetical protein [Zhihengliuella flava]